MLAETRSQGFSVINLRKLYAEIAKSAGAKNKNMATNADGLPKIKRERIERIATQGGVGAELPIPT